MSGSELFFEVATYVVLFLILWQIIGPLYLKPFFALLTEREERTTGDEKRAYSMREQTREVVRQLEIKRQQARLDGIKLRDEQVQQARLRAESIIKSAEERADAEFQQAKAGIDLAKVKAMAEVETEAAKISDAIVGKMLAANAERTLH